MIFDTLTYSILTVGIILAFAVIRLTLINDRLRANLKDSRDD
jgi:hypothetical protein